jgi:hypothetical protein
MAFACHALTNKNSLVQRRILKHLRGFVNHLFVVRDFKNVFLAFGGGGGDGGLV